MIDLREAAVDLSRLVELYVRRCFSHGSSPTGPGLMAYVRRFDGSQWQRLTQMKATDVAAFLAMTIQFVERTFDEAGAPTANLPKAPGSAPTYLVSDRFRVDAQPRVEFLLQRLSISEST